MLSLVFYRVIKAASFAGKKIITRVRNFISIYATSAKKMNGNCKLLECFEVHGA
jgi:hypothetical protein